MLVIAVAEPKWEYISWQQGGFGEDHRWVRCRDWAMLDVVCKREGWILAVVAHAEILVLLYWPFSVGDVGLKRTIGVQTAIGEISEKYVYLPLLGCQVTLPYQNMHCMVQWCWVLWMNRG